MKKILGLLFVFVVAFVPACGESGNSSVKCYTDDDCPVGQQCVSGNCLIPADDGPRTCIDINDCNIGEYCADGICQSIPDEPQDEPDGGDDGYDGQDDGDADDGGDEEPDGQDGGDEVADEDLRDFSYLNFTVAVQRGGTSGPASQCVNSVRPEANVGPVLPDTQIAGGYVLSGTVRDSSGSAVSGATVSLLSSRPICLPEETASDGGGQYGFYLPSGGPYKIQAVAPSGVTGHAEVSSLGSATSQDVQLPATEDLQGGPLCEAASGCGDNVALGNWTVSAYYASGPNAGKMAHAGVAVSAAEFNIPLENGPYYNWYAAPGQIGQFPDIQMITGTFCHDCSNCCDNNSYSARSWLRVKLGHTFSGQATAGGQDSPQSLLTLVEQQDSVLKFVTPSGTGGNYQLALPMGTFDLSVIPAMNAFGAGAMQFVSPSLAVYPNSGDLNTDAAMAVGQQVLFSGRLVDGGGAPVAGATVSLMLNEATQVEGSYNWCDPNPVVSAADGTFSVPCNLAP